jgi:sulfate adenylyltransferase
MESKEHIPAHGGKLINLLVDHDTAESLKQEAMGWPSVTLTERQVNELELLMNGGFSPLDGYLGSNDYQSVLSKMRLQDGTLWPMPVCLDVAPAVAEKLEVGQKVALRTPKALCRLYWKFQKSTR